MIKSRRELENLANQWMKHAMTDLRRQLVNFIEQNGTDDAELAYALTVPTEEIQNILNGSGSVELSTFAKVLIGTDNAVIIKPLTQIKQKGLTPPCGRMETHTTPFGNTNEQETEEVINKVRKPKSMPNRLPNGRFAPKNHVSSCVKRVRLEDLDLDELGREELCDIIVQNHWNSEINLDTSRRSELIDYLQLKMNENEINQHTNNRDTIEQEHTQESEIEMTEKERIAKMLAEEVERNPHLFEAVKKYLS